ncbi:MAG: sigma-70 family RNA polymerase sigma factor [Polyangiaceae bacterium]
MDLHAGSAVESVALLLDRCVAGEPAAWRWLHARYYRTAVCVLRRLGVAPHQLEDCCQDVFLDVFRSLGGFRHEADFRTWLYRICVGRARVARRRTKVARILDNLFASNVEEAGEAPLDEGRASRQLGKALECLSDAERAVFVLFELEGLSGREVAEIVGCTEASVFRRLHHARKRFRAVVEEQEP